MRKRIISAAVVLGLGIAGITLAQQDGDRRGQPAVDKAKLRSQVVKLRVEIEMLQLDHDADREIIVAWMKNVREAERLGADPYGTGLDSDLGAMMLLDAKASAGNAEAKKEMERTGREGVDNEDDFRKALTESAKKRKTTVDAYIARKRKEYAKQAEELALKQLELDLAESEILNRNAKS
jgi:hypothetical protein